MRVDFELPDVAEEKKPLLIQQATTWEPPNISTSIGLRFRRLLKLIELNAPVGIIENGKMLLAEAIFRYDQYVEWSELDADEATEPPLLDDDYEGDENEGDGEL